MKITLRPYAKDTSRWQLDIRLMHPCHPERELRRRAVAPPGMDPKQARLWGERQVPSMLRALMGGPELPGAAVESAPARKEVAPKTAPTKAAPAMTLADFYQQRFEPEHVRLQKHATRDYYAKMWRNHLAPLLGALPLRALDEDRISAFRAALHGRLAASTANVVLSKLGKMLRFARKLRTIDIVPNIERLPVPRKRPMAVLSDEAIARLVAAARRRGADGLAVCLLALDAGMRVSEICALEWGDIDLHEGAMIVQHNVYQGEAQTPKGRIGKLALTAALHQALTGLRREHTLGPLVVFLVFKDRSPFLRRHALEALNFWITVYIGLAISVVLMLILVGFVTFAVIGIAALVLSIIAALAANKGEEYRYPFTLRLVT